MRGSKQITCMIKGARLYHMPCNVEIDLLKITKSVVMVWLWWWCLGLFPPHFVVTVVVVVVVVVFIPLLGRHRRYLH